MAGSKVLKKIDVQIACSGLALYSLFSEKKVEIRITNNEKNYEFLHHGEKPGLFSRFPHYSLFVIHSFSVSDLNALSNVPGY